MTNDSLLQVLTSGGDERIAIDPVTGANRYYMDPTRFHGLLQRGSCTVGTLNERSHEVATRFLERYDSLDYDELVAAQATGSAERATAETAAGAAAAGGAGGGGEAAAGAAGASGAAAPLG